MEGRGEEGSRERERKAGRQVQEAREGAEDGWKEGNGGGRRKGRAGREG